MKALIYSLVPVLLVACSVEEYRPRREQRVEDTNSSRPLPRQPQIIYLGCGVDDPTDGGQGDCSVEMGVGGHGFTELRRGGFEELRTVEVEAPGLDAECLAHSLSVYDTVSCRAGSLCSYECETSQECGFSSDAAPNRRGKCIHRGDASRCTIPCKTDSDCDAGLHCAKTEFGRTCLLTETPWTAECAGDDFAIGGQGGASF